jgi:hypothetical protein
LCDSSSRYSCVLLRNEGRNAGVARIFLRYELKRTLPTFAAFTSRRTPTLARGGGVQLTIAVRHARPYARLSPHRTTTWRRSWGCAQRARNARQATGGCARLFSVLNDSNRHSFHNRNIQQGGLECIPARTASPPCRRSGATAGCRAAGDPLDRAGRAATPPRARVAARQQDRRRRRRW